MTFDVRKVFEALSEFDQDAADLYLERAVLERERDVVRSLLLLLLSLSLSLFFSSRDCADLESLPDTHYLEFTVAQRPRQPLPRETRRPRRRTRREGTFEGPR